MIRDSNHSPKLVVPYKLRTRYLHQAHEGTNHSGLTRMQELLSTYWWEFKNRDIKSYVDSCDTCAKCKGNYGKRTRWPIGHYKRGRKPFELVFIDFVTMPNSKGKRYIRTILYMLCEDRNCEWTDILESVTSSMNATINSATGVSSHYTITGRHPNTDLPKLL